MIREWATDEVVELTGVTRCCLEHWVTEGVVKQGNSGELESLRWNYSDLMDVCLSQKLRDFGFPLDKISEIIDGFDDAIEGTLNLYLVGNEEETHWIEHSWPEVSSLIPTYHDHICIRISDIIRDLNYRLESR